MDDRKGALLRRRCAGCFLSIDNSRHFWRPQARILLNGILIITYYNEIRLSSVRGVCGNPRCAGHFRAAWLRLKQTDLIPGKGQFR